MAQVWIQFKQKLSIGKQNYSGGVIGVKVFNFWHYMEEGTNISMLVFQ